MKVLQYVNSLSNGGIYQYQKLLISNLRNPNIEFSIVSRTSTTIQDDFFDFIDVQSIPIKGIKDLKSLMKFRRYLNENEIDIIHCHSVQTMIYTVIVRAFKRKKVIWSDLHSYNFKDFGTKIFFSAKFCAKYCDQIIVGTADRKQQIIRELGIIPEKILVVNAGIDVEKFNVKQVQINYLKNSLPSIKGNKIITIIGRLSEEKGHIYLIRAAEVLKNKGFENLKFIIIGDGPLLSELKQVVKEKNMSKNFVFYGQTNHIPEILQDTDIAVLPALHDNMAYAILEALAMSKPVIATNVGGIPEVITNLETGLLIPPKDHMSLATAIEFLLENETKAIEMAIKGESLIRNDFTLQQHVDSIQHIYTSLYTSSINEGRVY